MHITNWADAHANLPPWARWIAKADVVPLWNNQLGQRVGPLEQEGVLFSESAIDTDTVQAYLETDYTVHAADTFALKVGSSSSGLAALYAAHGSDCSAFITAFNPFSRQLDAGENNQRQSSLAAELTRRGLKHFSGIGQHPSNLWPGEHSFLVLGITLESAKTLGARFEQNAILWSGSDAVPQLVLLR